MPHGAINVPKIMGHNNYTVLFQTSECGFEQLQHNYGYFNPWQNKPSK